MCHLLGAHILANERKGKNVPNVPIGGEQQSANEKFHQRSSGKKLDKIKELTRCSK